MAVRINWIASNTHVKRHEVKSDASFKINTTGIQPSFPGTFLLRSHSWAKNLYFILLNKYLFILLLPGLVITSKPSAKCQKMANNGKITTNSTHHYGIALSTALTY